MTHVGVTFLLCVGMKITCVYEGAVRGHDDRSAGCTAGCIKRETW